MRSVSSSFHYSAFTFLSLRSLFQGVRSLFKGSRSLFKGVRSFFAAAGSFFNGLQFIGEKVLI